MKDNFRLVKQDLKDGRKVLFSGTPCQIAGLVSFLRELYTTNNLLLVDLVCHGIPSPLLWSKFISNLSQKYGKLEYASFRNKHFGYAGSTMAMRFADGKMRYTERDIQFYKKLFFDDINTRPSCFKCHFKTVKRVSDFTIFDCWHVNEIDKSLDDDKGTTWVLVQSTKGLDYFEQVRKQINVVEAPVSKAIQLDGMLATHCTTPNPRRHEFFKDIQIHEFEELLNKYFPMTIKKRIVNIVKPILGKIGMIKILKRL
jgi:coenzyme F420-reducing hydrogenase beta subunit